MGLNKFLLLEDESPIPEPLTDVAQLKLFAREAEVNENFDLAAKFYQEVSRCSHSGSSCSGVIQLNSTLTLFFLNSVVGASTGSIHTF